MRSPLFFLVSLAFVTAPMSTGAQGIPAVIDLREGEEDLRVLGLDEQGLLGRAVVLGDINGDGRGDLILGIPEADREGTTALQSAGEVWVVFGHAPVPALIDVDDISNSEGFHVIGEEEFADLGTAVGAGDINGDGIDDLIVAEPEADPNVSGNVRTGAGRVHIVFGAEDLDGSLDLAYHNPDVMISGADFQDSIAACIAVGDLNADGRGDLVLGVPDADRDQTGTNDLAGEVFILPGRESWLNRIDLRGPPSNVYVIRGANAGDQLGSAVAVGDINGDGYDDLAIGAPGVNQTDPGRSNAGEIEVLLGSASLLTGSRVIDLDTRDPDLRLRGDDTGDELGRGVAMGDFNGDGLMDIVAGAPLADHLGIDRLEAGEAVLWWGRAALPGAVDLSLGQEDVRVLGRDEDDETGHELAAGDLDGDGRDEWVVATALADTFFPVRGDAGEINIFTGSSLVALVSGTVLDLDDDPQAVRLHGDTTTDLWGDAAHAWHSFARSGFNDLIVGGPQFDPVVSSDTRFQAGAGALILGRSDLTTATRSIFSRADDAPPAWLGEVIRFGIDYASGTGPAQTTVTLTRSAPSGSGLSSGVATATWEASTTRTGWTSAVLSLRCTDAEIAGLDETSLRIHTAPTAGGPWTSLPTTIDERANLASASVSALGFFALAEARSSDLLIEYLLGITDTPPPNSNPNGDAFVDIADVVTHLLAGD
ncbi:FG-GAP repeat protein [Candidatus Sumerlaeota bacterium]|nr:FG-GAP repeat protein [Candidatus Sumerlaeota bacterium]